MSYIRIFPILGLIPLLLLVACKEPPLCNDTAVQDTVKELANTAYSAAFSNIDKWVGPPLKLTEIVNISLDLPAVTKYDKDAQIRTCAATIVLKALPGKKEAMTAIYNRQYGEAGILVSEQKANASYTVQFEEGGTSRFIVKTLGMESSPSLWLTLLGYGERSTRANAAVPKAVAIKEETKSNTVSTIPASFEICKGSDEAACITSIGGNLFITNIYSLTDKDKAFISESIANKTVICLSDVTNGENFQYFDGMKSGGCQ